MPQHRYYVGGSLPLDDPTYITRQADEELYQGLQTGEFCYVLNSRQTGKSSLRIRTMQRLRAEGAVCITIDLTEIGTVGIEPEQWYAGIIDKITDSLNLYDIFNLDDWWRSYSRLSLTQRLSKFFEEVLLEEISQKIIIFVDEIDSILKFTFKDDFFALIRFFYNQRTENPKYNRLTFALLGVATPSGLIQDEQRTPFNIGKAIDLRGFQLNEVSNLAQGLIGKVDNPMSVLKEVLNWTGGQPFLTQKVCKCIQLCTSPILDGNESEQVSKIIKSKILDNWENQDEPEHLRTIQNRIISRNELYEKMDHLKTVQNQISFQNKQHEQRTFRLLDLYEKILHRKDIDVSDGFEELIELRLSGLIVKFDGKLQVYNHIYEKIFDQTWITQQLAGLRPYAIQLDAWIKSNKEDESYLLQGKDLKNALTWSENKGLTDLDHQFLAASRDLETKQIKQNNKKARRTLKLTVGIIIALFGLGAWYLSYLSSNISENFRTIEKQELEKSTLEKDIESAKQSLRDSLETLKTTKDSLVDIGKDLNNLGKQPTASNFSKELDAIVSDKLFYTCGDVEKAIKKLIEANLLRSALKPEYVVQTSDNSGVKVFPNLRGDAAISAISDGTVVTYSDDNNLKIQDNIQWRKIEYRVPEKDDKQVGWVADRYLIPRLSPERCKTKY